MQAYSRATGNRPLSGYVHPVYVRYALPASALSLSTCSCFHFVLPPTSQRRKYQIRTTGRANAAGEQTQIINFAQAAAAAQQSHHSLSRPLSPFGRSHHTSGWFIHGYGGFAVADWESEARGPSIAGCGLGGGFFPPRPDALSAQVRS